MTPPRIWIKPDTTLPGVGTWTDTNNGSAEMEGAVESAPVSELETMRNLVQRATFFVPPHMSAWIADARAALKGDTP